jgi:hypothetical protein
VSAAASSAAGSVSKGVAGAVCNKSRIQDIDQLKAAVARHPAGEQTLSKADLEAQKTAIYNTTLCKENRLAPFDAKNGTAKLHEGMTIHDLDEEENRIQRGKRYAAQVGAHHYPESVMLGGKSVTFHHA